MRTYLPLDTLTLDSQSGLVLITSKNKNADAQIALRREGDYMVLSASYGPVEIALRPRYEELRRTLARLQPIGGLQTARQVGSADAFLAVGRDADDALILRPTLVGDASGYITLNLTLTPAVKAQLFEWLGIISDQPSA